MREIKFRSWSLDTKEMMPWEEFMVEWFDDETVVPMQFTGLKDKAGTDIYEGDLVTDGHTVFVIIWYKGRFDFERVSGAYQYPYFGDNCSRMEVIGNIYSNPELLPSPPTTAI